MAWERRGGRTYFYAAERQNGRVVKTYLGSGVVADLAARFVACARLARAEEAAALAAERAKLAGPDAASAALDRACELMLVATLAAAGYHRPGGHPWRRNRAGRED